MHELYPGPTGLNGAALFHRLLELGGQSNTTELTEPIPHSLINSYQDVGRVLECPERFCSSRGIGLYPKPPIEGCSLNLSPPPIAQPLRRKVSRWFQQQLNLKKSAIVDLAIRLVSSTTDDFVGEVADPLAWNSLALLLKLKSDQNDLLRQASVALAEAKSAKAISQADERLLDLLRETPITPAFGLSQNDRLYLGRLLMVTGWLSNSAALARGMHLILESTSDATSYQQLLEQPNLANELFRLTSPVVRIGRSDLGSDPPRRVMLNLAAANRDARYLRDVNSIHSNLQPVQHLAFGHGIHRCLGQSLAQFSMTSLLDALKLRDRPTCQAEPVWRSSTFILGYQQLRLNWNHGL